MQQSIQKAQLWYQNLTSDDVKIYLDELSAISTANAISSRAIRTNRYKIEMPTYVDIEEESSALKKEQKKLILDYIYVVNELVFGDRNDVTMNERYELLAKRLTDIQHELSTYQHYIHLDPDNDVAMIHPPQINRIIKKKKREGEVLKGGGIATFITNDTPKASPPPYNRNIKDKVKRLLKSHLA